ncbi:hypothetical protein [Modestobacter sp. Leaf380]|uniref:hypothetical protein n=1 Tax=Modestobacter sp. Leaf380 TaxID=1736356 RepID=UPI00138F13CF|nr:hypothetical protein [Modestobacter sp. Leaf380]
MTATATVGCLGEVSVVVRVPGLLVGTTVQVVVSGSAPIEAEVLPNGDVVVQGIGVPELEQPVLDVTVVVEGDMVYQATATTTPAPESCVDEAASIVLSRDCATPDLVLASVDVVLPDGTYGVAVVGASGNRDVVLASADIEVTGGRLTGTLPLVSADGILPLDAFTGIALVIDGATYASVAGDDVSLPTCVVPQPQPQPLPVAPVHPAPSVPTQPAATPSTPVHPVATPTAASTTARSTTTAAPTALARTGSESSSLLLLAGAFLVLGGLTTLAARRTAR